MNKRYFVGLLQPIMVALLLLGCRNEESKDLYPEVTIDYSKCMQKHWDELPDSLLGEKKYVMLDTTNAECDFGEMSKVMVRNNHIYILDAHLKKIVVYDMQGRGISQVGNRGQGPEEYLDIADFDVASDGSIYFIDGRLDKLFCFTSDLKFKSSTPLPFEADILLIVDDGFLFGLSSWNKGVQEKSKIIHTDSSINVVDSYLEYDEYTDPSYWISLYSFIRSDDYISYNQPIDNHIYLFDATGKLQECINFDFSDQNVPDEYKKDIERNLTSFDQYCMLKNFTVVTHRIIAGSFWKKRKTVPFVLDRLQNICYSADPRENYDNSATAGYSDSFWITYFEPEVETQEVLPDSVQSYLNSGGFVLGLQSLF